MISVAEEVSGFDTVSAGDKAHPAEAATQNLGPSRASGVHEPPVPDDAVVREIAAANQLLVASERARALLRGLVFILDHHGAPQAVLDSFRTQAMAYLTCSEEAIYFKRAKYLTVAPMARYLRCDAPKSPDKAFAPIGQYRNWANSRLRVFCVKNTHLWYSFLQGKRCAAPASEELVLTTYREHREAMDQDDPITDTTHDRVMKDLKPVLEKVRQTLRQVYSTAGREADWLTPEETSHSASTRACWEASRAKGGQLGSIMRTLPRIQAANPKNHVASSVGRLNPDLVCMTFYPRAIVSGRVELNVIIEIYAYPDGEREWYDHLRRTNVMYAQEQRVLKATIQAVLEPLKVRVISKGNAAPYYASKRLQKALHGVLREMDCFRLIGAPLQTTDLFDLAVNPVLTGDGPLEWFSIDYSAATDKLSARLSASILNYLIEGQDPAMCNMWRSVLAPHMCEYPFPFSEDVLPVQQRNGQLMGSILSFPILCLANLGLYLSVIREDPRPLADKLKGVLVNGDDMLYVAPQSLWSKHVELGTAVGLSMSPGKAYHHPVYANANSACYHFDLRRFLYSERFEDTDLRKGRARPAGTSWWTVMRHSSTPKYIPFLNVGLFFGQNKVMGGHGDDVIGLDEDEKSYVTVINRILDGALPGKGKDVMAQYLTRFSTEIKAECRGRNMFLPISLGGMGVTPPEGFKFKVTAPQRLLARAIFDDSPYGVVSALPLEEQHLQASLKEAPQPVTAPWLSGAPCDGGFEPDPRRELTPVKLADKFKSLLSRTDMGKGELVTSNGRIYRLMSDKMLRFEFRLTAARRPGTKYQARHPVLGRFHRDMERDTFKSNIDLVVEEEGNTILFGVPEPADYLAIEALSLDFPRTFTDIEISHDWANDPTFNVRIHRIEVDDEVQACPV